MSKKIGIEIVITGLVVENIPKNLEFYDELLILCLDDDVKAKVIKQVYKQIAGQVLKPIGVELLKDYFIAL